MIYRGAIELTMAKWKPKDVIALTALVGCLALMGMGYNHLISICFAGIISAYVGIDIAFNRRK